MATGGLFGDVLENANNAALKVEETNTLLLPVQIGRPGSQQSSSRNLSPMDRHMSQMPSRLSLNEKVDPAIEFMESQTDKKSALRKAGYFDKLVQSLESGMDEKMALSMAWKSIQGPVPQEEEEQKTGLLLPSVEMVEQERAHMMAKIAQKLAAKRQENVKITADVISQEVMAEHKEAIISSSTVAERSLEAVKRLIQKLNQVANEIDNPLSNGIPQFKDEPEEFRRIKQQQYCISLLLSEFDSITEAITYGRERDVARTHDKNLKELLAQQHKQLTTEYEKRISHDNCNSRIRQLQVENDKMKEDSNKTVTLNVKLTAELNELRMKKGLLDSEHALLLDELAKRRIKQRKLKEKVIRLQEIVKEYTDLGDEASSFRPGSAISSAKELPKGGLKKRPTSAYSAVSFQEAKSADEKSDQDSDSNDEIVEKPKRPDWNKSTATNLLSQKAPPSVIWVPSEYDSAAYESQTETEERKIHLKQKSASDRQQMHEHLVREKNKTRSNV
ncbi:hypothetical protein EDD86DRAFT_59238 [Gorgonomyces haynaldii]|nr:hypothetical protein EDD86DRAFT_59238 [Gorgonomyces haynaldii]